MHTIRKVISKYSNGCLQSTQVYRWRLSCLCILVKSRTRASPDLFIYWSSGRHPWCLQLYCPVSSGVQSLGQYLKYLYVRMWRPCSCECFCPKSFFLMSMWIIPAIIQSVKCNTDVLHLLWGLSKCVYWLPWNCLPTLDNVIQTWESSSRGLHYVTW